MAVAEVRVPRLFSNQMVLQQNTDNAVWGFADPGEKVSVEASWGTSVTTTANASGDWQVFSEDAFARNGSFAHHSRKKYDFAE